MRKIAFIACLLWLIPRTLWALPPYIPGQDYRVLQEAVPTSDNKVTVIEFFSYACPHCSAFEPYLESWLKTHEQEVNFSKVPVLFQPTWDLYAKTYYIANAFGVADKVTPAVFNALHEQNEELNSVDKMADLVSRYGISKKTFKQAYYSSQAIDLSVAQGKALLKQYKIHGVPAIAVAGRYEVDSALAKGDWKKMLATIDYLIKINAGAKHG